jgi:hypothetical protein
MSDMSNFDDFTKKQLGNYSPEVPLHIWDNIAAKREKKKPYPFLLTFFSKKNLLLTTGLITLLTAGFFILNNQTTDMVNKDVAGSTNKLMDKKKEPVTTASNKQQNDLIQNNNSTADDLNNKRPGPPENISGKVEIPVSKNNTGNFNNTSSTNSTIISSLKKEEQHKLLTNKRDKHINKNGKTTIRSSLNDAEEFNAGTITKSKENYAENNTDEVSLISLLLYQPESITAEVVKGIALDKNMLPAIQLPPCPAIEKNAAGNKYYIEVYAGPDYASKSFTDTAHSVLLQKRKESTSFRSAFSAGFRYTRVFNNGASIRAGINYSQINEKFSYVQSNIVQVTYITDPVTGDTTGTFVTTGTRYKTTNNRYHTIDVPLLLGFETGNGRLHANFNAGVVLNIYSWQKGESLDTSFRPVNITTGKSASLYQYKTNIGAGFMGGISVYYKLNDRLHLLAEPYWRYNFSPMNKEMLSLQEKFSTIGLRLGVRWDLY